MLTDTHVAQTGTGAAAALGSAPAAGAGGAGGSGGLSRTAIILIAVFASLAGVALFGMVILGVVWLNRRNSADDLAEHETSVAMSGDSRAVSHRPVTLAFYPSYKLVG